MLIKKNSLITIDQMKLIMNINTSSDYEYCYIRDQSYTIPRVTDIKDFDISIFDITFKGMPTSDLKFKIQIDVFEMRFIKDKIELIKIIKTFLEKAIDEDRLFECDKIKLINLILEYKVPLSIEKRNKFINYLNKFSALDCSIKSYKDNLERIENEKIHQQKIIDELIKGFEIQSI